MEHTSDKTNEKAAFICAECGLRYEEKTWAEKCAAWCRQHKSCNLDIIAHAVENHRSL